MYHLPVDNLFHSLYDVLHRLWKDLIMWTTKRILDFALTMNCWRNSAISAGMRAEAWGGRWSTWFAAWCLISRSSMGRFASRNDLGYFVNCFHPLFVVILRRRGGEIICIMPIVVPRIASTSSFMAPEDPQPYVKPRIRLICKSIAQCAVNPWLANVHHAVHFVKVWNTNAVLIAENRISK